MGFIMRCWKKRGANKPSEDDDVTSSLLRLNTHQGQRRKLTQLLLALPLIWSVSSPSQADDGQGRIVYAEIIRAEHDYVVNADIQMVLNDRLVDALHRGVALHFTAEFVIEKPRWYWFDEEVVSRKLSYRLTYHSITRNYHLHNGTATQSFESLDSAMATMRTIREWPIVSVDSLQPGVSYQAALRFGHDISMLPKTFQVTAISSREWNQSTDWFEWTFLAGIP